MKANKLAEALSGQDTGRFWSLIKRQLGGGVPLPPSFGKVAGDHNISNMWRTHFSAILNDLTCGSDDMVLCHINSVMSAVTPPVTAEDVQNAILRLKGGKSPGWDQITTDHLLHMCSEVSAVIAVMFNSMIHHSVLPDGLIFSLLVPLVKDKSGVLDDVSNYRAIALSSVLSKVLEFVLMDRLDPYLSTSEAQFGFKPSHSTTQATHVLKETVNYYTERGSPVYTCFLDASKAFDRVCHTKLFQILEERGVPSAYLKLLLYWYRCQRASVRWSQSESEPFPIQNGVRQGGNLSPLLFNVYIDELLCDLRKLSIGCHVGTCAVNVLAYADDIVLLSPTRTGLQMLINRCEQFAVSRNIKFNVHKTACMVFNPRKPYKAVHLCTSRLPTVTLDGHELKWVSQFKYLGHILASDLSDAQDIRRVKRTLYYGTNMLCARLGYACKDTLIRLFKSYCAHMYGCELWNVDGSKRAFRELCVAYHSCVKKILKVPIWCRNHELCHQSKLLTCPMLIAKRQLVFHRGTRVCENGIVKSSLYSGIGQRGIAASVHLKIRQRYDLLDLDFDAVSVNDISNIFVSHLERVIHERAAQRHDHDLCLSST